MAVVGRCYLGAETTSARQRRKPIQRFRTHPVRKLARGVATVSGVKGEPGSTYRSSCGPRHERRHGDGTGRSGHLGRAKGFNAHRRHAETVRPDPVSNHT